MFLEPFFGFPDWTRQIRVEDRRSHKLGRTSSVAKTLNRGLGVTRKVDLQNPPLQLIQVHVVNRIPGILRRAERDKRESTMFSTCKVARSMFPTERDGWNTGVLSCCEGFVGAVGSWISMMSPAGIACQPCSRTRGI